MKAGVNRWDLLGELEASVPGDRIPDIVRRTGEWLRTDACPIPDYVSEALMFMNPDQPAWYLYEVALNTFSRLWSARLNGLDSESIRVLEIALTEIMRIVRREAWLHCYNVADIERHEIRPFHLYYRNRLSIPQFVASLERTGATSEVVSISDMLHRKFQFMPEYTATSGTIIARKHF